MRKINFKKIFSEKSPAPGIIVFFSISVLMLSLTIHSFAQWTPPGQEPPGGNKPPPINVTDNPQSKGGPLAISTMASPPSMGFSVLGGRVAIGSGVAGADNRLNIEAVGTNKNYLRLASENGRSAIHFYRSGSGAGTFVNQSASIMFHDGEGDGGIGNLRFRVGGSGSDVSGNNPYQSTILRLRTNRSDFYTPVYANTFYYDSDESLKENIQPIPNAISSILQLEGVAYELKENKEKRIGLVAQDVEKVFPEVVTTNPEDGLKSLNYGSLIAPAIEAIKELHYENQELRNKYEELEKRIEILENR